MIPKDKIDEWKKALTNHRAAPIHERARECESWKDGRCNCGMLADDKLIYDAVPMLIAEVEALTRDGRCVPVDIDLYGYDKAAITPPPTSAIDDDLAKELGVKGYRVVLRPSASSVSVKFKNGKEIRIGAWANRTDIGPVCEHAARRETGGERIRLLSEIAKVAKEYVEVGEHQCAMEGYIEKYGCDTCQSGADKRLGELLKELERMDADGA